MIFCCFPDTKSRCNPKFPKFPKLNPDTCNIADVHYAIGIKPPGNMESMVKLEIYHKNIRYGEISLGWNRKQQFTHNS